jgi:ppGpp synthetase/RelA/SpoT-type nucleotidyltranferase
VGTSELDSLGETKALFDALLAEAEQYLRVDDLPSLFQGYGLLLSSLAPGVGFSDPTVHLAMDLGLHAARLSLPASCLVSALVFHPVLAGRLTEADVKRQFQPRLADGSIPKLETPKHKRSSRQSETPAKPPQPEMEILDVLRSLIALSQKFDRQLPWVNESVVETAGSSWPGAVTHGGRNRASAGSNSLSIETLAFLQLSGSPFVAVLKVLDRQRLLADLDRFHFEPKLRASIAANTLDVFAPVAEALGLWTIKSQMEDACLKILEPDVYAAIVDDLQERLSERLAMTERAIEAIRNELESAGLNATYKGRPKHIYGLRRKLRQGMRVSEVNDAVGVRVVMGRVEDCYTALGLLMGGFQIPSGVYEHGKLYRDWIANPKPNGYQSIHLTIEFEERPVEVQLRTLAMEQVAEYGLAAHWVYRAAGNSPVRQKKYESYVGPVARFRQLYEAKQRSEARGRESWWMAKELRSGQSTRTEP